LPTDQAGRPDGADRRGILALVRELIGAALELAHNTARLAACEARVVLRRLAARLAVFVVSLVVAAAGLLVVLAGAALLLEGLTGIPLWLSLVLVGGVVVVAGVVGAAWAVRRLGDRDLAFPGTLAEIDSDVESLKAACREE
jgi:uncharacterized membrane protein YqjE